MPQPNIEALMRASQLMRQGPGLPSGVASGIAQDRLDPIEQREMEQREFERQQLAQQEAEQASGLAALKQMMLDSAASPDLESPPRPMVREMAQSYGASPQESQDLARMMQPPAPAQAQGLGLDEDDMADLATTLSAAAQGISPSQLAAGVDATATGQPIPLQVLVAEVSNMLTAQGKSPEAVAQATAQLTAGYRY